MLRNYFKIAWRNLWKHKVFSLINIGGLAIGLSAFWLIALYIVNELSFDRYHKDSERIYRVVSHAKFAGGSFDISATSTPLAPTLKKEYPEVEQAVRIGVEGGGILSYEEKHLKEDAIGFADNSLFDIFSYRFLYGNKNKALTQPQSIVLTKSLAEKLFGDAAIALDKTVYFENNYPNQVTGVIEDGPSNSHLKFKAIRSFPANFQEDWSQHYLITYIKLSRNAEIEKLQAAMPGLTDRYIKPALSANLDKLKYTCTLNFNTK